MLAVTTFLSITIPEILARAREKKKKKSTQIGKRNELSLTVDDIVYVKSQDIYALKKYLS